MSNILPKFCQKLVTTLRRGAGAGGGRRGAGGAGAGAGGAAGAAGAAGAGRGPRLRGLRARVAGTALSPPGLQTVGENEQYIRWYAKVIVYNLHGFNFPTVIYSVIFSDGSITVIVA